MTTMTLREFLLGPSNGRLSFANTDVELKAMEATKSDFFSDAPVATHSVGSVDPMDEEIVLPVYYSFEDDPQYIKSMK